MALATSSRCSQAWPALRARGIVAIVEVEFRVRDSVVAEVNPVATPSEDYRTVRSAVHSFQCRAGPGGSGDALASCNAQLSTGLWCNVI